VTKERDNENDEEVESLRKKVKTSGNLKKKPIQRNPPPAANRVSEKEMVDHNYIVSLNLNRQKH
jgi:hypothetical protein